MRGEVDGGQCVCMSEWEMVRSGYVYGWCMWAGCIRMQGRSVCEVRCIGVWETISAAQCMSDEETVCEVYG